jgi:hypothetical protein
VEPIFGRLISLPYIIYWQTLNFDDIHSSGPDGGPLSSYMITYGLPYMQYSLYLLHVASTIELVSPCIIAVNALRAYAGMLIEAALNGTSLPHY